MKLEDIQDMYRHDFSSFIRFTFRELYPYTQYQHNWHIDVMAYHLNEVIQGRTKRLIINVPPRMLKSHCASIAFPAYILGRNPTKRLLYLHGSKTLGFELEDHCLNLMNSKRYRSLFPHTKIKSETGRLSSSFGGRRQFMPLTERLTGLGSDIIVIDDPISTADARDDSLRKQLNTQFDENILQRLDDKNNGAIILVMQRLHEDDLTNHLLSKNEGWVHLDLPAIAMKDEAWQMHDGKFYTRKKGEPIHSERESKEQLIETLTSIGGYAFAYQYLQGQYKPRFSNQGHGCIWLTPQREGVFWDARTSPRGPFGFYHFKEEELMMPKVFGIGDDPCPPNMRDGLTKEELEISATLQRETMLEHQRKVACGELEY